MEMFTERRSRSRDSSPLKRVSVNSNWSSEEKPIPSDPHRKDSFPVREERRKETNIQDSGSNYSSRLTSEGDLLLKPMLHFGRQTSGPLSGNAMKALLVDEMSRDIESGKRPSVVARLMGLDGFPPQQQHVVKNDKRTTACRRCGNLYESQSRKRSSREHRQFKDAYEMAESPKILFEGSQSQLSFRRNSYQDEIPFYGGKFVDGKRLCSYEKFHDTREFNDALEVLHSNNDLTLKFLNTPDSVSAEYLHYPCDTQNCGHGKGLNTLKHNISSIEFQSNREASQKIDVSFSHKYQGGLHRHSCRKRGSNSQNLSSFPAGMKDNSNAIPARIVVLKPNSANLQSNVKHTSSLNDLSDFEVCNEKCTWHGEAELWSKKYLPCGLDISSSDFQESRQLAREITWQLKEKLGNGSINVSLNGCKGYSADETSHNLSGNDSSYDSEATNVFSKIPLHRRSRGKASGSRFTESSVNKEARKRLSERWKMTHIAQENGSISKGNTLGEMLAIPEFHLRLSEGSAVHDGFCRLGKKDGMAGSATPSSIKKNVPLAKLSRSRSLPASYDYLGSPETSWKREACIAERFLVPKERISHHGNKAMRKAGSIRTRNRRPGMLHRQDIDISALDIQSGMNLKESDFEGNGSPDVKAVISETPARVVCGSAIVDEVVSLEPGIDPQFLACSDERTASLEIPGAMTVQDEICGTDLDQPMCKKSLKWCKAADFTCSQRPASEPELPGSVDEDQPSPNSILEGSFMEDLSSGSECFQRVNAGLHGLRMQLQLLRLETEAYDEVPLLISSEEYASDGSNGLIEARGSDDGEGSWVSSYFLDVLADSGFNDSEPEELKETWYSIGCLISPWVFEKLEKKYSAHEACTRVERRLLFDRIGSGVTEILEMVTDPHPWVNHRKKIACPRWDTDGIKAVLWQWLKQEEVEIECDLLHLVLESDLKWMDLAGHVDGVAREIEILVMDELVADFVTI